MSEKSMKPKRKVGRPKKVDIDPSFVIADPYDPVSTLKSLGYDPIVKTVVQIKEVEKEIRWVKKQSRPSQAAISALMATKRALNADLIKFGYRPIPEKVINENHNFSFGIELTDSNGETVEVTRDMEIEEVETRH